MSMDGLRGGGGFLVCIFISSLCQNFGGCLFSHCLPPPNMQVAMTSPVTTEAAGPTSYKISFIMPSKYTKDTLPRPNNSAVEIKEMAVSWG